MVLVDYYLRACRAEVDSALERLLSTSDEAPTLAVEAMRYSLFAGGKRLRPTLTLAAAETTAGTLTGTARELVYPAACAIELVHTYSLVHDDLPCMDDDALRRGRPTVHVAYGEATAVLAGDALLAAAFEVVLTAPAAGVAFEQRAAAAALLARAAGSLELVGGQVDDLGFDPASADGAFVESVHARKTAALIVAAIVGGATLGVPTPSSARPCAASVWEWESPSRSPTICSMLARTPARWSE